ncbi:GntR family transcriptional regulator [Paracidovorax avenae]|uniref:GntR family transcriptional regulator n=1 Tax=Paracidovorax avenae TaxID=80867 RepID=UPI000D17643F|nr:GntR family transcriptional regulator [Paracidovorax avenae]AVS61687.1 GntR family transcriptional regulator [Paracidovorax avenae]
MLSIHDEDDRSVAAEIAKALAARIISGELAPGERLRQDHVALEFNVSHVPVREALRRLEGRGLVVNEPRRGARVAELDAGQVLEVAEMRASLESLALRHAMARHGDAHITVARAALGEPMDPLDVFRLEAANRAFHHALISPCNMPRLLSNIGELQQASARHLFATWRHLKYQPRSHREHLEILEAVERNDASRACDLLARHIVSAGQALAQALPRSVPAAGPT